MDKNDFTRIYPVLGGSRGWRSRILFRLLNRYQFQESIPGWNTYYKNRQGKDNVYLCLYMDFYTVVVNVYFVYISPRVIHPYILSYLTSIERAATFHIKRRNFSFSIRIAYSKKFYSKMKM